jgi:exodeoxyribonuclease VII large subunit
MTDTSNNLPELTVSELSNALKRSVEDRFGLVRVRGEISGLKIAASGHAYLALKDDSALLDGVMWKGSVNQMKFRPEDGLEVICTGKLTTYPGRSKYQIVIERMEPAGVGALMALLEERKRLFAAEGLFAPERKRKIPYLPQVIGVVTSPTGAVIRDILHRLADRFPRDVLLWPVLVQGEGAAAQIAAAIRGFNALSPNGDIKRPDVIIVARGGGSIEDLWAFNEESVVRAAAESQIPLISAVGHETDTTLIDYVSDRRAPTPTAAAEMAVPVRAELLADVASFGARLERAVAKGLEQRRAHVAGLARGLPLPRELLGLARQRYDEAAGRLPRALTLGLTVWRGRLDRSAAKLTPVSLSQRVARGITDVSRTGLALDKAMARLLEQRQTSLGQGARLLDSLSPKSTLNRGYAIVRDDAGHIITLTAQVTEVITVEFQDGVVAATTAMLSPAPSRKTKSSGTAGQGSLF